jgi:predicted phage terminase large subunit-like protein
MTENPYLDQKSYLESLNRLHVLDREQLLNGNWEIRPSGGIFRRVWFEVVNEPPAGLPIMVRYWDLSATVTGDYTVGLKLGEKNGVYWVMDIQRIRATPMIIEALVSQTAKLDGKTVHIRMEQEPGSSGVNTIDNYARNVLQGYIFKGDKKTGDKIVRALPVSSAAENGNIKIVRGRYISSFFDEIEAFPETENDDQVDALSGAFQAIQDIKGNTLFQVGQIDFLLGGQDETRKAQSIAKRRGLKTTPQELPSMSPDSSDVR